MIDNIDEAIKYLERYIPTPDKKHPGELGIKRMQYLMELLDNPQLKYPTIHVGGTSGKGSTATIIASILSTKYKVGLHTSPHLVKITERISILSNIKYQISNIKNTDQKLNISENQFIELLNNIIPIIKTVENSKYGKPSYFEIVAAMAFLYFYQVKVDIAVIEVGMGGRYDATNVIRPLVAVFTNVGLDHTEILGDTVEKIAEDKVGIIKKGIEVVSGVTQRSVVDIISAKCKAQSAKLSLLFPPPSGESLYAGHPRGVFDVFSYHVRKLDSEGSVFDYKGEKTIENLKLKLLGEHQVENAALAIRAVKVSRGPLAISARGPLIKEKDIRLGLLSAFIPGRLEIINRNPLVILDGAHNLDKVKALVSSIKTIFPKRKVITIIAIKNDKNAKEMLTQLLNISDKMIFTKFQLKADIGIINSYKPKKLFTIAKIIQQRYASRYTNVVKEMLVMDNAIKALEEAIKTAKPDDLILVTGSLYLVGEITKFANKQICK